MTETKVVLIFDGTFEGFLSAAATAIRENLTDVEWLTDTERASRLFREGRYIPTDRRKARQLWQSLSESGTSERRLVYFAYLSEQSALLPTIFDYIKLLCNGEAIGSPGNRSGLRARLLPWAERVGREKRKWEAKWNFSPGAETQWRCSIRPSHDILPLLTRHCRHKLGPRPWVLYDARRKYGFRSTGGCIERFGVPAATASPRKTMREVAA